MTTTSAPGKLMLLGEHAVVYGHPCIVTAIDTRLRVVVSKRDDNSFIFNTPGMSDHTFLDAITSYATTVWNPPQGATIEVKSPFSGKYGFGSSSAVTVATMKALAELFNISLTKQELFEHCLKIILQVQKIGSGFDVAASIFGGTIFYEQFGKRIEPIQHQPYAVVIGYSGQKANTVAIVEEVKKKKELYPEKVERMFQAISGLVNKAKGAIENKDWETLGKCMNINQEYLRELGVSTQSLESLISAAIKAGAYGAKLSGAGGGDCMIALCPQENIETVKTAIVSANGEVVSVLPDAPGVTIETI